MITGLVVVAIVAAAAVSAAVYRHRVSGPLVTDLGAEAALLQPSSLPALHRPNAPAPTGSLGLVTYRVPLGYRPGHPDHIVPADAWMPVLVAGATGGGKTTGLILPAALTWAGSLLSTSVKTDVLRSSLRWRRTLGDVSIVDVSGAAKRDEQLSPHVRPWTPLAAATDWPSAARVAATIITASKEDGAGRDTFFDEMAEMLLAGLLWLHGTRDEGSTMHRVIRDLTSLLAEVDQDEDDIEPSGRPAPKMTGWDRLLERIKLHVDRRQPIEGDSAEMAGMVLSSFSGYSDRTGSSIVGSTLAALRAYTVNPGIAATHSKDPNLFRPEQLVETTSSLYLLGTGEDQALYRPVYAALLDTCFAAAERAAEEAGGALEIPLLAALDELCNVAPIGRLPELAATVRSRKIQLLTIVQDLSQLEARYGKAGAQTIISNHRTRLVLPGIGCDDTLAWASRLMGEHKIEMISRTETEARSTGDSSSDSAESPSSRSKSKSKSIGITRSETWRPLATPERIGNLAPTEILAVLTTGPAQLTQWRVYGDPMLAPRLDSTYELSPLDDPIWTHALPTPKPAAPQPALPPAGGLDRSDTFKP